MKITRYDILLWLLLLGSVALIYFVAIPHYRRENPDLHLPADAR